MTPLLISGKAAKSVTLLRVVGYKQRDTMKQAETECSLPSSKSFPAKNTPTGSSNRSIFESV